MRLGKGEASSILGPDLRQEDEPEPNRRIQACVGETGLPAIAGTAVSCTEKFISAILVQFACGADLILVQKNLRAVIIAQNSFLSNYLEVDHGQERHWTHDRMGRCSR